MVVYITQLQDDPDQANQSLEPEVDYTLIIDNYKLIKTSYFGKNTADTVCSWKFTLYIFFCNFIGFSRFKIRVIHDFYISSTR